MAKAPTASNRFRTPNESTGSSPFGATLSPFAASPTQSPSSFTRAAPASPASPASTSSPFTASPSQMAATNIQVEEEEQDLPVDAFEVSCCNSLPLTKLERVPVCTNIH